MSTEPLIQVRGLSIRLGEFAVHDVDLEVRKGEYFVLLGPTGAGKTVLLECIAGLHRPNRGDIFVGGERVNDVPPEQRGLGYLPQDYALFPHLTVEQNIGFGLRLRRRPAAEIAARTAELAKLLGITHLLRRSPTRLSGGECQRVALARALAIGPKVLLLDEPLSALDEQTREALCAELRRIHGELATTTIHVSHNFEETLAVADRIGIIHQGRIRQVGTPDEVFRRPASEFVARFVRCDNIWEGQAFRSARGSTVTVGGVRFETSEAAEGHVLMTVRPEDVELSTPDGRVNEVVGRITRVVNKGAVVRVDVGAGVPVVALVGRRAFLQSGLQVGAQVAASFDPDQAHVLVNHGETSAL